MGLNWNRFILETNRVNIYQALDKDYVHSTEDYLRKRLNDYVQAAIDYGVILKSRRSLTRRSSLNESAIM